MAYGSGRGFSEVWTLILVLFVLLAIVAAAAGFWGGGY
jgi:flagellar basal body-associated protein FliL